MNMVIEIRSSAMVLERKIYLIRSGFLKSEFYVFNQKIDFRYQNQLDLFSMARTNVLLSYDPKIISNGSIVFV